MTAEQLIVFAVWLVLALLGGALIVFVWERLRSRYSAGGASAPAASEASSDSKSRSDP
jgi:hypothetical protein